MKYIIYYFLLIMLIIIVLPLLIVKSFGGIKKDVLDERKDNNIKVFFHKTKEVKVVPMEEYLRGVVAAEMPASFNIEALKAQAVAARTYAFNKTKNRQVTADTVHPDAEVCTDSTHCQAWISRQEAFNMWPAAQRGTYWDKISWAVRSTAGEIVYYQDQVANPVFHANSGGRTENAENVWSGNPVPYLKGVESPGEESSSNFLSEAEFTYQQIVERISKQYEDLKISEDDFKNSIRIIDYTENGRVDNIAIGNKTLKATELRKLLGLKSTNFSFELSGNKVVFKVKGYGHGVGMSQYGANHLANNGKNYKEILKHYYKGVEIK